MRFGPSHQGGERGEKREGGEKMGKGGKVDIGNPCSFSTLGRWTNRVLYTRVYEFNTGRDAYRHWDFPPELSFPYNLHVTQK